MLFLVAAVLLGGQSITVAEANEDQTRAVVADPSFDGTFQPSVEEYVVLPRDTLWGICEQITGAPWLWPKIWAYNPEISNPHWIYPGDVIRFYPPVGPLPLLADADALPERGTAGMRQVAKSDQDPNAADKAEGGEKTEKGDKNTDSIEVIGVLPAAPKRIRHKDVVHADLRVFIRSTKPTDLGELTHASPDQMNLSQGDQIYIDLIRGARVPAVGEHVVVYRIDNEIRSFMRMKRVGYVIQITGEAVVLKQEKGRVVARITKNWFEITRGQRIMAHMPRHVTVRVHPSHEKVSGTVVGTEKGTYSMVGGDGLVFIDQGKQQGLKPGDTLTIVGSNGQPATGVIRRSTETDVPIGTAVVVDAQDKVATCFVTRSIREVVTGDRVQTEPHAL